MHTKVLPASSTQHELRHLWVLMRPVLRSRMGVLALATYGVGMLALLMPGTSLAFALLPLAATCVLVVATMVYFVLLDTQPPDTTRASSNDMPQLHAFACLVGMSAALHQDARALHRHLRAHSHVPIASPRQFRRRVGVAVVLVRLAYSGLLLCLAGGIVGVFTAVQSGSPAGIINAGGLTAVAGVGLAVMGHRLRSLSAISALPISEATTTTTASAMHRNAEKVGQRDQDDTVREWIVSGLYRLQCTVRAVPWLHLTSLAIILPLEPMLRAICAVALLLHLQYAHNDVLRAVRRERDKARADEQHYQSMVAELLEPVITKAYRKTPRSDHPSDDETPPQAR